MLGDALCWAPKIFTSSASRIERNRGPSTSRRATSHKRRRDEHGEVVDVQSGAARKRHWPRPRREGPGQLWHRQRQPLGNRRERVGRVTQHFHGPHGQDLFRFGVEIGRGRNVDFPDWGVIVDKAGVRPTTNRDHGSKEAKRRSGRGSQTSTPSFAPPHCQRERPQRGRTVRTVGLAMLVPCYSSQKRVTG